MINDEKHVPTCGVSSSKPTSCKASSSRNSGSGKERSPSGKSHEGPQSAPTSGSSDSPFITYSPINIINIYINININENLYLSLYRSNKKKRNYFDCKKEKTEINWLFNLKHITNIPTLFTMKCFNLNNYFNHFCGY